MMEPGTTKQTEVWGNRCEIQLDCLQGRVNDPVRLRDLRPGMVVGLHLLLGVGEGLLPILLLDELVQRLAVRDCCLEV